MEDIELVIKIPEGLKNDFESEQWTALSCMEMKDALEKATPLPKRHGRLIDADKIEWYGCTTAFDCPHKDQECKDCNRAECSKSQVDDIPTIIEADNGESEEDE